MTKTEIGVLIAIFLSAVFFCISFNATCNDASKLAEEIHENGGLKAVVKEVWEGKAKDTIPEDSE